MANEVIPDEILTIAAAHEDLGIAEATKLQEAQRSFLPTEVLSHIENTYISQDSPESFEAFLEGKEAFELKNSAAIAVDVTGYTTMQNEHPELATSLIGDFKVMLAELADEWGDEVMLLKGAGDEVLLSHQFSADASDKADALLRSVKFSLQVQSRFSKILMQEQYAAIVKLYGEKYPDESPVHIGIATPKKSDGDHMCVQIVDLGTRKDFVVSGGLLDSKKLASGFISINEALAEAVSQETDTDTFMAKYASRLAELGLQVTEEDNPGFPPKPGKKHLVIRAKADADLESAHRGLEDFVQQTTKAPSVVDGGLHMPSDKQVALAAELAPPYLKEVKEHENPELYKTGEGDAAFIFVNGLDALKFDPAISTEIASLCATHLAKKLHEVGWELKEVEFDGQGNFRLIGLNGVYAAAKVDDIMLSLQEGLQETTIGEVLDAEGLKVENFSPVEQSQLRAARLSFVAGVSSADYRIDEKIRTSEGNAGKYFDGDSVGGELINVAARAGGFGMYFDESKLAQALSDEQQAQLAEIRNGSYYVVAHTETRPAGSITVPTVLKGFEDPVPLTFVRLQSRS